MEPVRGVRVEAFDFARDGDGSGGEGLGERDCAAHGLAIQHYNGLTEGQWVRGSTLMQKSRLTFVTTGTGTTSPGGAGARGRSIQMTKTAMRRKEAVMARRGGLPCARAEG